MSRRTPLRRAAHLLLVAAWLVAGGLAAATTLSEELGRNEVRVYSAPFVVEPGASVAALRLPERLELLGYRRVHEQPSAPGEYFWGNDRLWVYRRAFRAGGRTHPLDLWRVDLDRTTGRIRGASPRAGAGRPAPLLLEPLLLAESLDADRAPRRPVHLEALPEHVWRSVLAAEDARFFAHSGLDARSLARALLRNALAGRIEQGGSTITQQLIKVRDLAPQRTLGRKVSEAVRALALEAEHDKREILAAYLDSVYFGHVDGLGVYGLGAAARAYFSRDAADLGLAEAALLAAMIQGPNRLSPLRHPDAARARQAWVLSRLEELGWAGHREVAAAKARGLAGLHPEPPPRPTAPHLLGWVRELAAAEAPRRLERGRGVVAETTLDPLLQRLADASVAEGLEEIDRRRALVAALVALDAASGEVLAYVGAPPRLRGDRFDRVRRARRQPGSTVKPLVLLEAFEDCGGRAPLYPASRVYDRPLRLDLPSGPWEPANADGRFAGVVDLRQATIRSLNVPFVRVARWCGFDPTAERLRAAGLELPAAPPPAFVLGAVETTPLALASSYTALANGGQRSAALPLRRLERPSGRRLARFSPRRARLAGAGAAYLVRDLLRQALAEGTARAGSPGIATAFGKTGTSSEGRDAWFAGGAGSVIAVVWVGSDDGAAKGLTGGREAAAIWRRFMSAAAAARPDLPAPPPSQVVERWVDDATGLLVSGERVGAHRDLFRKGSLPPRQGWLRLRRAVPIVD